MIKITIVWKDQTFYPSANMGKDNANSKHSSKSSRKNQLKELNCILLFKDPKPSNREIKAKPYEADDTKVSEQIKKFKTDDNDTNLIGLMNNIVSLGDLYVM